jgi:hypothetical protein
VTFEEIMMAALLWRLPWMLPDFMLRHRKERIVEVEYMMHALSIRDFLRKCVLQSHAFRKRKVQQVFPVLFVRPIQQNLTISMSIFDFVVGLFWPDRCKRDT